MSLYFNISSSIRIAGGYRYQTFLQNTVTSPPHLRTRKQNQLPSLPPRASTRSVAAPVEKMETRNKSLNLFRSQLDGCTDHLEAEAEGVAVEDQGEAVTSLQERLAVRNHLLKRKLEMEDEMMHLQKRACVLQERKEVNLSLNYNVSITFINNTNYFCLFTETERRKTASSERAARD